MNHIIPSELGSVEDLPQVHHNFEKMRVAAGLQWDNYQEGETHDANEEDNVLDEQSWNRDKNARKITDGHQFWPWDHHHLFPAAPFPLFGPIIAQKVEYKAREIIKSPSSQVWLLVAMKTHPWSFLGNSMDVVCHDCLPGRSFQLTTLDSHFVSCV